VAVAVPRHAVAAAEFRGLGTSQPPGRAEKRLMFEIFVETNNTFSLYFVAI